MVLNAADLTKYLVRFKQRKLLHLGGGAIHSVFFQLHSKLLSFNAGKIIGSVQK